MPLLNIHMNLLLMVVMLFSFNTTRVSWYGPGFDGRKTANGEIYSQDSLTAASPVLPFNTLVKITNLENNKTVIVRINDRGPYKCYLDTTGVKKKVRPYYPLKAHPTRGFDLSKAAFDSIADLKKGVLKVKYEVLQTRKRYKFKN